MLQINANLNQNAITMHSFDNGRKCQIQPSDSSEICEFDFHVMYPKLQLLNKDIVVSNGLAFFYTIKGRPTKDCQKLVLCIPILLMLNK